MKKTNSKKILIGLSTISFLFIPSIAVSCSKSVDNLSYTQEYVDEQFRIFNDSIINDNVKNNLYFENFNFNNGKAILSLDEISNIISLPQLKDSFDYEFVVTEKSNTLVEIEMIVKDKNGKILNSANGINKTKEVEIKRLTAAEKDQINATYSNWSSNTLEIRNEKNELLTNDKYATMLPSYLSLPNITINVSNQVQNENIVSDIQFDDVNGKIIVPVDVINKQTGLIFYTSEYKNKQPIEISGFIKQTSRNEEISQIYKTISGTYNVSQIKKDTPFLASGITKISDVILFLNEFKSNEKIAQMLQTIEASKTAWYNLSITTSANDINGTITIDWTITDAFTDYVIRPQNIIKTTTFNELTKLEITNQDGTKDLSQVDNGYKAYSQLSKLKLKNNFDFMTLPSNFSDPISIDWLLSNTDILELIPTIIKENNYLKFSIETNGKTNNFKLSLSQENIANKRANDVYGILEIPIMLEIEISLANQMQFVKFLPPNGKNNDNNYNSATREATISVGNFLSNDNVDSAIFYNFFTSNQAINVELNNKYNFDEILNSCANDETKVFELLNEEIKKSIINSFTNEKEKETIVNLLKKYTLYFGLTKNIPIHKNSSTSFSTSSVHISLRSANENENIINVPFYKNGQIQEYPKVTINVLLVI